MSEARYVSIEGIAKYFSVSISTVRVWLYSGAIPVTSYIKVGQTYRFNPEMIEQALLQKTREENNEKEAEQAPMQGDLLGEQTDEPNEPNEVKKTTTITTDEDY